MEFQLVARIIVKTPPTLPRRTSETGQRKSALDSVEGLLNTRAASYRVKDLTIAIR